MQGPLRFREPSEVVQDNVWQEQLVCSSPAAMTGVVIGSCA